MEFLKGKSPRSTMWYIYIGVILGAVLIVSLLEVGLSAAAGNFLLVVYAIVANALTIVFGIRRLHDMGKSGWWMLFALVPLLNMALALALLFRPSSDHPEPQENNAAA